MKRANTKTHAGFTLFELMMTLAILAIVASVGIPSMRNAIEKRDAMSAAEEIYSQIKLARSESIARSQPVFLNLSPGTGWAIGFSNDQTCDPTDNVPACTLPDLDNNNPVTHRMTFADHENVSLSTTTNQITFLPQRGIASTATISIITTGEVGYRAEVSVGALGQVSLCSPNADPAQYLSGYRPCS